MRRSYRRLVRAGAVAFLLTDQVGISTAAASPGPRGGRAVAGPRGGGAYVGPHGGAAVRGPHGGGAAVGPHGGAAARGPYGGGAAVGPHGGAAVRSPYGGYAAGRYYGGHYYYRPAWGAATIGAFARPYAVYPGWRFYGTWGLAAGIATVSSLAFLSSGLLVGTYVAEAHTVYVYIVDEDGVQMEYRVDEAGRILSKRPVSAPP